jgi:hypothetical protein
VCHPAGGAPARGRRPAAFAWGATTGPPAAALVTPLPRPAVAAGATVALAYSTIEQFMIPVRASREFELPRAGVARLLMVMQLFDIVALVPVGLLADSRGARPVIGAILLLLAAGHVLVSFGALPVVVAGYALFGLGMAGWMLPLSVLRRETPPEHVAWRTALLRLVDGGLSRAVPGWPPRRAPRGRPARCRARRDGRAAPGARREFRYHGSGMADAGPPP